MCFDSPGDLLGLGLREAAGDFRRGSNRRSHHRRHNDLAVQEDCHRFADVVLGGGMDFPGTGWGEFDAHAIGRRPRWPNNLGRLDIAVTYQDLIVQANNLVGA